jgi:pimeloyl-ACP methyl ester carboxylesterase
VQDEPDESHPAENRRVGGAMTGRDRQPVPGVARAPDGIPLSFEVHGSGTPALVLVHGWSCDRRYWRGQLDAFADRHQVVAVDLAGHGESGGGRQRWTMAAFGDDVAAVVRHLRLGDVVLVGHSMGGDVVVETALRLGGQVLGVVWADTYDTLGDPPTREELEEFVGPFREDFVAAARAFVRRISGPARGDLVEWVAADMSAAPPEVAIDMMEHAVGNEPAVLAALPKLTAPVVAINAGHRPTDPEALRRHGVRPVVMPGVGHFLMLEDPGTFNRLLGEVVDEFRRAG